MGYFGWGSAGERTEGYTDNYAYSDGIGIPWGREARNGSHPIIVTSLEGWVRGRYGGRNGVMRFEPGGQTSGFYVGSDSRAAPTGQIGGIGALYTNGGSVRFVIDMDDSFYFGRGGGGSTFDSYGLFDGGRMLGGAANYVESPTPPRSRGISPDLYNSGRINFSWDAPESDGGTGIAGYRIYYSTNFNELNNGTAQGRFDAANWQRDAYFTGTPGVTYYFRICATNWVTDAAGTESHWSTIMGAEAPGLPSAPRSLTATPRANTYGTIDLSWTVPSTVPGGSVARYQIEITDPSNTVTTVTSTTTSATIGSDILTRANGSYKFVVYALNSFAVRNNLRSPASNQVTAVSPGAPSAPRNLTGSAHASIAGRIDLSWTVPADTAGGLTRYSVFYSTGDKITDTSSSTTSYSVTGLTPGTQYGFYVKAWNAAADSANMPSPNSNTIYVTALGEPDAPSNFTAAASTEVANRIRLTWTAPAGTTTGYSVYMSSLATTPIAVVYGTSYNADNLTAGTAYTFFVRARNAVTDATGSLGGPAAGPASATPRSDSAQPAPNYTAADTTNSALNGTYALTAVAANSISYSKTAADLAQTATPVTAVPNVTNITLNGSATITSIPTSTSFTFSRTIANIVSGTPVVNGTVDNTTNQSFNGTKTVTGVDAPNKRVQYSNTGPDFTANSAGGTLVNRTNAIYNGTGLTITAVTDTSLSYAKTNSNLSLAAASGTITNTTNRDNYNGIYPVFETPTYDTFTYMKSGAPDQAETALLDPYGDAHRTVSPATLDISYRSGWAG